MKESSKPNLFAFGMAIFSMFFGAGNVVFPLALGRDTQDMSIYAVIGLIITAVIMPLTGLISMMLFDANFKNFFKRIGKIPGALIALMILCVIGPFGGIPRIINISYDTLQVFIPNVPFMAFSAIFCLIVALFTWKESSVVSLIGKYLTPILLVSLFSIIILGLTVDIPIQQSSIEKTQAFTMGFFQGYGTLDLLASLFFSSIILAGFKNYISLSTKKDHFKLLRWSIISSTIAGFLLSITYLGFCIVTAKYSLILSEVPDAMLIGATAKAVLGNYGGLVAALSVALACLTTAIALVAVLAEYVESNAPKYNKSYHLGIIATLILSFLASSLKFTGIMDFLAPLLIVGYPSLIVLSLFNMLHKLTGIQMVKLPVYLTLLVTIIYYYS